MFKLDVNSLVILYPLFWSTGITKEWLYTLVHGDTIIYDEYKGIVSNVFISDVLYINSGTIDDVKFPYKMMKDCLVLANSHDKVVFTTTNHRLEKYAMKIGFSRIDNIYYKGVNR